MFVAVVLNYGNVSGTKNKNKPSLAGTYFGETAEEAGAKAMSFVSQWHVSYPNAQYETLCGELTMNVNPVQPEVKLTKADAYLACP
jgi:hypothetical protein